MGTGIFEVESTIVVLDSNTWDNVKSGKQQAILVTEPYAGQRQLTLVRDGGREKPFEARVSYWQTVRSPSIPGVPLYLVSLTSVERLQRRRRQKEELRRLARRDADRERWIKGAVPRRPK